MTFPATQYRSNAEYIEDLTDPNTLNQPMSLGLSEPPRSNSSQSYSQKVSRTSASGGYQNPYAPPPEKPNYRTDNTDILTEIFNNSSVPKPLTDEQNQKRLLNRGRLDTLGRVAMNLGDSLTLGLGGSPVLRDKSKTDEWYDRYYQSMAEDRKKLEDWNNQEYLRKLQSGMALTNQRDQDRNFQAQDYRDDTANYKWGEQQGMTKEQFEWQKANADKDFDLRKTNADRDYNLRNRNQSLAEKEFKERYGDEKVIYQASSGQTITRNIPKPEQKDIISRAKQDPYFAEFAKRYMSAKPVSIRGINEETGLSEMKTEWVDEMGRNITDQDLLQAYLRYQTEGSPNENYAIKNEVRGEAPPNTDYGHPQGSVVPNYAKEPTAQPQQPKKGLNKEDVTFLNERMDFYKANPNSDAFIDMVERLKQRGYSKKEAFQIINDRLN